MNYCFMEIYITNLKTSPDRRLHMEKQLVKTKTNYRFYDCVVGATLTEEEISVKCDVKDIARQNEKLLWFTRGIIGCTMTNQNIYREIIERNLPYILFMEDDVLIPENLEEILTYTESYLQQGDVILLFWKAWETLKLPKPVIETPFGFNYYIANNNHVFTGGSAYIVTRQAAEKMLAINTPIHTTPDNWGYYKNNNCIERLICAYPHCIQTADLKSTMGIGKFLFLRELIDKYKIFPVYQLLKWKRKQIKKKSQEVIFVKESH